MVPFPKRENQGGIRMEEDDDFSSGPVALGCPGSFSKKPSRMLDVALGSFSSVWLGLTFSLLELSCPVTLWQWTVLGLPKFLGSLVGFVSFLFPFPLPSLPFTCYSPLPLCSCTALAFRFLHPFPGVWFPRPLMWSSWGSVLRSLQPWPFTIASSRMTWSAALVIPLGSPPWTPCPHSQLRAQYCFWGV